MKNIKVILGSYAKHKRNNQFTRVSTIGFSVVPYAHAILVTFSCSPAFAYDFGDGSDTAVCNVQTRSKKGGNHVAPGPQGPRHWNLDSTIFID